MKRKIIARNRKALHEYLILDRFEAGLVLLGSEIKSIRAGQISIKEAYIRIDNRGEAWLVNAHIAAYNPASSRNHDPTRERKLLLHRKELDKLFNEVRQKSVTIIPLQIFLMGGKAKVEIALARGKKLHDKRRSIAEKDVQRDLQRQLKNY